MKFVGNWKMNKSVNEAREFAAHLVRDLPLALHSEVTLLPPALSLAAVVEELKSSAINCGGQNCYYETSGAFTGETSPQALAQAGAKFCLVGHSERRQIFAESDEWLAKKLQALQKQGLTPIMCVGETIDQRRAGQTEAVITSQLKAGLKLADLNSSFWLAYEPVWAIGTGEVATIDQVAAAHLCLRSCLQEVAPQASTKTPILYGGSVKSDNVRELAQVKNVDGFLVGGASLKLADWIQLIQWGSEVKR